MSSLRIGMSNMVLSTEPCYHCRDDGRNAFSQLQLLRAHDLFGDFFVGVDAKQVPPF